MNRPARLLVALAGLWPQSVSAQDLAIPATELRGLDAIAERLAKVGLEDDTWTIIDLLRRCGYPDRSLSDLQESCEKSFLKAKPDKAKFDQFVSMLDAAVEKLVPVLGTLEGEAQQAFARELLVLDRRLEAPHRVLGHEQAHGRWIEPWMKPLLDSEVEAAEALASARALSPQPSRVTTSDVAFLEKLLGQPGTLAEGWNITIHTTMSRQQSAQILVDFARAAAFANWLLTRKVEPFRVRAFQLLLVDSRERYQKLIDILQSDGRMPAEEASYQKKASFFWDARNEYLVMHARDPHAFSAYLLAEALNNLSYRPQQFLRAGLANYVCLAVLDERMPRYVPEGKAATEAALPTPRWLRAESGLTGLRAHIAGLVRRGRDPDWKQAFECGGIGDLQGDLLLKNTEMLRFLCAQGPIDQALSKCNENDATDAASRIALVEGQFSIDVADLDAKWRRWIGTDAPSLAESLEARVDVDRLKERKRLLDRLVEIRKQSGAQREDPKQSLGFHGLLSRGANRVAEYARSLEPRPTEWAAAHIQDKTSPAFSLEGMQAGPHCLIAFDAENADAAIDRWLASYYDRLDLLRPGILDVGFAHVEDTCVLDCGSLVTRPDGEFMVRWPYPDMKRVPTHYAPELRRPVADAGDHEWGYPITLQLLRGEETAPGEVTMELFVGNPSRGKQVECVFTSPDSPSNPAWVPPDTYALIPKEPLAARTQFTVIATFQSTDQRVLWKFKT
ncbi:MAG: hypothetical protein KDB80_12655 [Planctomycetes bacterium]|nr:hypothetical protein [Planctomycetota bacterium]